MEPVQLAVYKLQMQMGETQQEIDSHKKNAAMMTQLVSKIIALRATVSDVCSAALTAGKRASHSATVAHTATLTYILPVGLGLGVDRDADLMKEIAARLLMSAQTRASNMEIRHRNKLEILLGKEQEEQDAYSDAFLDWRKEHKHE